MQRKVIIGLIILIPVLISAFVSFMILNRPGQQQLFPNQNKSTQLPIPTPTSVSIVDNLPFPPPNASTTEVDSFYKEALAKAPESSQITFSSCNPKPFIIKIISGQKLRVNNTDSKERAIAIGRDQTDIIPARGSTTITPTAAQGIGVYGIHCDGSKKVNGLLVVTNRE